MLLPPLEKLRLGAPTHTRYKDGARIPPDDPAALRLEEQQDAITLLPVLEYAHASTRGRPPPLVARCPPERGGVVIVLHCGHAFCAASLMSWTWEHKGATCPKCRAPYTNQDIDDLVPPDSAARERLIQARDQLYTVRQQGDVADHDPLDPLRDNDFADANDVPLPPPSPPPWVLDAVDAVDADGADGADEGFGWAPPGANIWDLPGENEWPLPTPNNL